MLQYNDDWNLETITATQNVRNIHTAILHLPAHAATESLSIQNALIYLFHRLQN